MFERKWKTHFQTGLWHSEVSAPLGRPLLPTRVSVFCVLIAAFIFLFSVRGWESRILVQCLYFHFSIEVSWWVVQGAPWLLQNVSWEVFPPHYILGWRSWVYSPGCAYVGATPSVHRYLTLFLYVHSLELCCPSEHGVQKHVTDLMPNSASTTDPSSGGVGGSHWVTSLQVRGQMAKHGLSIPGITPFIVHYFLPAQWCLGPHQQKAEGRADVYVSAPPAGPGVAVAPWSLPL